MLTSDMLSKLATCISIDKLRGASLEYKKKKILKSRIDDN